MKKLFDGVFLASDFDATLTDRSGNIPQANIDALKYFISEGGRFTVCTGRTREGFHRFGESFINAPVIVANGAMAYDWSLQRVVFESCIGAENIPVLSALAERYPETAIELFSSSKGAFVLKPDRETYGHFEGLGFNFIEKNEISDDIFPLVKVMLGARERSLEIQAYLKSIDMGDMFFIPCTGSYVEILSKTAGKGKGLLKTADILGVKHENTYAVGDGSNDVDMLKAAALGFAPADGDMLAKQNADMVVCGCNDGAVAGVVEILYEIYR